ncbi:hypothetical protein EBQ74_00630 [bacterium]|nr:hypothetical protein [bacterium]
MQIQAWFRTRQFLCFIFLISVSTISCTERFSKQQMGNEISSQPRLLFDVNFIAQEISALLRVKSCEEGGGTVYLPAGTYTLNETIYVPQFTSLRGAGGATTILIGPTGDIPAIEIGGSPHCDRPNNIKGAYDNEISGLAIRGRLGGGSTKPLIKINSGEYVRVRMNRLTGNAFGILIDGGTHHDIRNNLFENHLDSAVKITGTESGHLPTSHSIEGNLFVALRNGIFIESMESGFISNNIFDGLTGSGLIFRRFTSTTAANSILTGIHVVQNIFFNTNQSQIRFASGFYYGQGINLLENKFLPSEGSVVHGIEVEANGPHPSIRSLIVNKNEFIGHRKAPIKIAGGFSFSLSDNVFSDFGSGSSLNPERNSGIWLVGSRCGGKVDAGMISSNRFFPRNPFGPQHVGWGIFNQCMDPQAQLEINANIMPGGLAQYIVGGELAASGENFPSSGEIRAPSPYPGDFKSQQISLLLSQIDRSRPGCDMTLPFSQETDSSPRINQALIALRPAGRLCLAPGRYTLGSTVRIPSGKSLIGEGAKRTQFFRTGNFSPTVAVEGGSTAHQTEVSGLFFRHMNDVSYAKTNGGNQLDNLVDPETSHLFVNERANFLIQDNYFWRLPLGVRIRGGSNIQIINNKFGGINDFLHSGLQEGIASILIEKGGILDSKRVSILNNFFSGAASDKHDIDWGQGRVVRRSQFEDWAHNNAGPLHAVKVVSLRGGSIGLNYFGGQSRSTILINPATRVEDLNIFGNYLDGATESQVKIEGETTRSIHLKGNGFFAAGNNRYGLLNISTHPNSVSENLIVSGNYFIHHINNPIKLIGASNFQIQYNIFEGYNFWGHLVKENFTQLTNSDYSAGVAVYGGDCGDHPATRGQIISNFFGGNDFGPSNSDHNWAIYGTYLGCLKNDQDKVCVRGNKGRVREQLSVGGPSICN